VWGSGLELHGGKKGVEGGRVALVVEQLECGRNDRSVPTVVEMIGQFRQWTVEQFPFQSRIWYTQSNEESRQRNCPSACHLVDATLEMIYLQTILVLAPPSYP